MLYKITYQNFDVQSVEADTVESWSNDYAFFGDGGNRLIALFARKLIRSVIREDSD